jgi:hypothetical protein
LLINLTRGQPDSGAHFDDHRPDRLSVMRTPVALPPDLRGVQAVCERCKEIDADIARYEAMKTKSVDRVFLAGLDEVLRNYQAEKAALHQDGSKAA